VLIIHGTDDEVVPFDLGQALSSRIGGAEFLRVEHGHHNDLWDRPEVRAAVRSFVARR
jgi:pimeloyl-ACP methyl ester carboxylesterase